MQQNRNLSFEDYLMQVYAKDYNGTDDEMVDKFDNWFENLDKDEIIQYAKIIIKKIT